MARPSAIVMDPGAERRAMIALVAVFALVVQALIPSLASAAPLSLDGKIPLCAAHGSADLPLGDFAPDPPCDHCVCIAPGVIPPSAAVTPVAYARAAPTAFVRPSLRVPPARAPPRPPGQGPPRPTA